LKTGSEEETANADAEFADRGEEEVGGQRAEFNRWGAAGTLPLPSDFCLGWKLLKIKDAEQT